MGSNPTVFRHDNFFSLKLKRLAHFRLEVSSKCDLEAENSSTLYKFCEGRKELWPMGSNADLVKQAHGNVAIIMSRTMKFPSLQILCLGFLFRHIFFNVVTYFVLQSSAMYGAF